MAYEVSMVELDFHFSVFDLDDKKKDPIEK